MIRALSLLAVAMLAAADSPAVRKIPGINATDPYPQGCVDCHVNRTDMPAPLSTDIKQWTTKVDPKLLAKLQPLAPKGVTLKGKHPNVLAMIKEIPGSCLKCHAIGSKMAPSLAAMIHTVHLSNDEANRFMTTFQGECTYCHKLNAATGAWTEPSAAEK